MILHRFRSLPPAPRPGRRRGRPVDAAGLSADDTHSVTHVPAEVPVHANFDRDDLEQAQGILLDNALEYAPHGGAITAETNRENGHVRLGFSDTGIGVPREEIPRIFDLAEAHGGTLDVHSAPGKGSTFVLEL